MEQHPETGSPVNLNSLQIDDDAVPNGCQVMHISNHGMLLYCRPDERLHAFGKGDPVDVHLRVQHNGEQKKMTIPSYVRHMAENTIDVEFQHPDPVLLDLIESYRTSDSHTLDVVISNAQAGHEQPEIIPLPGSHLPAREARKSSVSPAGTPKSSRRYFPALAMLLGLASMLAGVYYYTNTLQNRISQLEALAFTKDGEFADMQNKLFSASLLEGRYASLDARISAQGDAIASLQQQLQRYFTGTPVASVDNISQTTGPAAVEVDSALQTDAAPAAAMDTNTPPVLSVTAGAADPAEVSGETAGQVTGPISRTGASSQPVEQEIQKETKAIEPLNAETTIISSGPWIINLMSSRDRQYLENIARRAQARNIPTELNSTNVKGKVYWRLQVTGFDSLAAAKSRAREIRQSLGLGEVWFLKRKPPA